MSLLFHYKALAVNHAVLTLRGRWARPRPLITVSVIGPTNTFATEGLLDTGADETVFPEDVAVKVGVDLTTAPGGAGVAATLAGVSLRYAEVSMRIADGNEQREWQAWVGFTPAKLYRPMLGFAGFLQFFTATFHGDREEVELTVNSLYPGT
jgi:hypothetical protein